MKLQVLTVLLLSVALASTGPISERPTILVNSQFFDPSFIIYRSQNDIVDIFVPLNGLNFEADADEDAPEETILFFTEKDLANDAEKGLYIRRNNETKLLLDTGRSSTATSGDNAKVYFAAADGIYVYNTEKNEAEKYGTLNDDLIDIAIDNTSSVIYAVNKNKELYKVTDNGEKYVKINDASNVDQIVIDNWNNLYYRSGKDVFVLNEDGVKKIDGVPSGESLKLLRPPFIIPAGTVLIADDKAYIVYANGTLERTAVEIEAKPTAYSMEAVLLQYFGYDKNIYEYNLLTVMLSDTPSELGSYLDNMKDEIQTIASRSKNQVHN